MTKVNNWGKVLLKGSVLVTAVEASSKLITLLLLPLFSRYLSPEDFGIVSMVTIIITALSLIYNPGLTSATMRLYHDTENLEERKILIGSAYYFYLFFPLAITILFIFIGPSIFDLVFKDFLFYPFGFMAIMLAFFYQPKNIWITMMLLQYKITTSSVYTLISVIVGILVSILLVVKFEMGAMGKIIAMFPPLIFLFIVAHFSIKKYTKGIWSLSSIKKQLIFGLPIIGAIWSTSLLQVIDRYIIERMVNLNSVGIYSFAFQIAQIPLLLIVGIRKIWNPLFYENMNKNDYHVIAKLVYLYNFVLSIICIFIILFNREFVHYFIDERYVSSIPIISVLVIGIYFSGLLLIPNSVLGYEKKFNITSWIALLAMIIDACLNFLFIPFWGIMGSAIATAIAYFVYFIVGHLYSKRKSVKFSNSQNLVIPPLLVVSSTLLTLFFDYELSSTTEVIIKIIFFTIVILLMLFIGKIKLKDIRNFF